MPSTLENLLANKPTSYWANRGLLTLNVMLLLAQVSSYATGYDSSMMNSLQSVTYWQDYFNNPSGSVLGLFNCINPVGQILSFPLQAFFSDKWGRKWGMVIGAFIVLVGAILQGAAPNIGAFIVARGLIGFGIGINITAAPVYILETAFPAHRGPLTALYNSLWSLGSVAAGWITYGTFLMASNWSWRIPSLLQGLACVLQLFLVWFIPESPRWLVEHDRLQEATEILIKYHANGNATDPIVQLELVEIQEAIEVDREINKSVGWLTLLRNRANLKRTALIVSVGVFSQTNGGGVISYYLSLVLDSIGYTDAGQQLLINGILAAYGLILGVIAAFLVNHFTRRFLFNFSTIGQFLVFIAWTVCEKVYETSSDAGNANAAAGRMVLACIFLFNFFAASGWTPLQVVYCIEILPIAIRARGLAVYNVSVSIAGVVNQYLNPVGLGNLGWKYYICYDVWACIIVLTVFFLYPETQGVSLEETAAKFDGQNIVEDIALKAEQAVSTSEVTPATEIKEPIHEERVVVHEV